MSKLYSRKEIIKKIVDENPNSLFVSSAGYTSRALYEVGDSPNNFYMMGSMGCALGFAIGLSLNTERIVTVFAGDGEILMSLGSLVLLNKLQREDKLKGWVRLVILDNNQYESTGGQDTCSNYVDFQNLAICEVYNIKSDESYVRIPLSPQEIKRRFYNEINGSK